MSNDIDELTALNRDYVASVQNSDVKRFDEILAADFYCSNPDKTLGRPRGVSQTDRSAGDDQKSDRARRQNPRAGRLRHHPRRHPLYDRRRPAGPWALHGLLGEAEREVARGVSACVAVATPVIPRRRQREPEIRNCALGESRSCGTRSRVQPCGLPRNDGTLDPQLSNMITLRSVLPAFMLAKPSLISESFSFAEIQSSRCSLPRM